MAKDPQSEETRQPKEQVVDPWNVSAAEGEDKIDYEKLIREYKPAVRLQQKVLYSCECKFNYILRCREIW